MVMLMGLDSKIKSSWLSLSFASFVLQCSKQHNNNNNIINKNYAKEEQYYIMRI